MLSCITMQTKNMRKAFDAFPEVLRVECTRSDASGDAARAGSSSSYKLFSLLAHDTFGMWQFVQVREQSQLSFLHTHILATDDLSYSTQ